MENGTPEELRTLVIKKGIIDEEGKANATAMNLLSGMHTSPLLNEVWGLTFQNLVTMDKLLELMHQADSAEKYEAFFGILKTLYVITNVLIPDEICYILECDDSVTRQMYAYEFLADFDDLMYDYLAEATEEAGN